MDSENSGAIFRLKNLALVRSEFVAAANKEGSNRSTTKPQNDAVGPASFEVAAVNKMFDEIYRATPMPSVILQQNNYNSNYWDQGHNFTPGLPATANSFGSADSSSSMNQNSFSYPYHQLAPQFNHQHKSLNPYENQHQYTHEDTQSLSSQFYTNGNGIDNRRISPIPAPPLETFRLPSQTHVTKEIDNELHQNSSSLVDRDHSHEEPAYLNNSGGYSFDSAALSDADPCSSMAENVSVGPDDEVIEVEPTVEGHVHSDSPKAASSINGSVVQSRNSIDSTIASDLSGHTGRSRQKRKYVMDSLFQLSTKSAAHQVSSSSRIEISLPDDISHDKASANKKVQGIASSSGSIISTKSKRDNLTNGLGRESGLTNKGNDCTEDDENISEDSVNSNSDEKSSKNSAVLSFISNLKQSKMSKGRDDTKRFGSLILVPQLSSIRYSSDEDQDYMDSSSSSSNSSSSSSSSSSSGSGKKKRGRLVKKTAVSEPEADLSSESICKKVVPDKQTDDGIHTKMSTVLKSTKQLESKSDKNENSSKIIPEESPKSTTKKSLEPEPASQPSGDAVTHVLNSSPTTRSRKALENSKKDPPEGIVLKSDIERAPSARRVTVKDPPEGIVLKSDIERAPSARRVTEKDPPEGIVLKSDIERAPSARRVTAKDPPEGIVLPSDIEVTSSSTSNSSRTDGTWSPEEALVLHTAQSQIEPTAPDFWEKVCTEMERTGYHRTSAECRDEWFQLSAEDRKKKTRHRQPKSKEGKITLALPPLGQDDKNSASEEPIKRKRKSRAEIQRLAEESSKATKSDDIFSFQKKQRTRQFLTVGSKKESLSDEITGPIISGLYPYNGPNPSLKDLIDISDLQSPGGSNSITRPGPATRGSSSPEKLKKSINATYVHILSKKVSAARHTKSIPEVPAKTTGKLYVKINRKVVQGTSTHGQVSAAIDPRTGRVTVTDKRSFLEDGDVNDGEESGSEYLRNMTEEEDGDF